MRQKWTFEKVKSVADQYTSKAEFIKNEPGAYQAAHRNCWIDIVCGHMAQGRKRRLSYDDLASRASPYKTLREFRERDQSAYAIARNQGVLANITKHMVQSETHKNQKHTRESLIQDAKQYASRTEWSRNSHNAYCAAIRLGILDDRELTGHMKRYKPRAKHTFASIQRDARTCKTCTEFRQQFPSAYVKASSMAWLDKVCSHMSGKKKKQWTTKNLSKLAAHFRTRAAFKKYEPAAYKAAFDLGVLSEVMPHAELNSLTE